MLANLDKKLSHLSTEERNGVAKLVQEFAHLFPDTPNRTKLVMHYVDVGNASPCKQHPYQVNRGVSRIFLMGFPSVRNYRKD